MKYFEVLGIPPARTVSQDEALKVALEERARELDFYWKRTTYCWTLNAAAFGGYFALAKDSAPQYTVLGIVACLGFLSATAWWCLNRGSKYWQENWELQVDLLELEFHGPLHRINPDVDRYRFWKLNRAYPFSVTKVNQHLSLFVVIIWAVLIGDAAWHHDWSFSTGSPVFGMVVSLSVIGCITFLTFGLSTPHHSVLGETVVLKYEPVEGESQR